MGYSDIPSTFAEAKKQLLDGKYIEYNVEVNGHIGDLLTKEAWMDDVESGTLIDYDGYGDQITQYGKFIGLIKPSEVDKILNATAYILWYNR